MNWVPVLAIVGAAFLIVVGVVSCKVVDLMLDGIAAASFCERCGNPRTGLAGCKGCGR